MEFRLAIMQDLQQLKLVYKDIIQHMDEHQIQIWDDVYPCEFFEEDIKHEQLYTLFDGDILVSALNLCDTNAGATSIIWKHGNCKALYVDRFAVNVNYLRKGIGDLMLTNAKKKAQALGYDYLRLFVVDINEPAIHLYEKNGFKKAEGIYHEVIDEDFVLHEYGYEVSLTSLV